MKKLITVLFSFAIVLASCVKEEVIPVTSVTLDSKGTSLIVGQSTTLTATISPSNADNKVLIWSSTRSDVASVERGVVTAVGAGEADIIVKTDDGAFTDKCTVTVVEKFISTTGISLDSHSTILYETQSDTLLVKVMPDDATNKNVIWASSNESVVKVAAGVITALKAGEAVVTATTEDGGFVDKCEVKVKCNVLGVKLNYPLVEINEGETFELSAVVYPSRAEDLSVEWSSENPDVATVDQDGKVTGLAKGQTTITVTTKDGGYTDECVIIVNSSVSAVSLDKEALALYVGENSTLKATITPENASNPNVRWSSTNTSVATVSDEGVVTAVKAGEAVICATTEDGGKHANCSVKVYNRVESVSLDKKVEKLAVNETLQLIAAVSPDNVKSDKVTWTSSNTAYAKVDANGLVTALSKGTVKITATSEEDKTKSATCEIEVVVPVASVTLNKQELSLNVGGSEKLTATLKPSNVTNPDVEWSSSDASVATVEGGLVKAVASGTAVITVTTSDGALSASCKVTVSQPTTGITLSKTSLNLRPGRSETLTATVLPENSTDNIVWTTSNDEVAIVVDGKVTAVNSGEAIITATSGSKSATCKVTVEVPVESVSLAKEEVTVNVGDTYTFSANILPSNATNKNVTWTSSNSEVVSINAEGIAKGMKSGSATITVTTEDGAKTATCKVTVSIPVVGVVMGRNTLTLPVGESEALTVQIVPSDATNQDVIWNSENETVATVSSTGVVTARAEGKAKITATSVDGGKKDACIVTVTVPVASVGLNVTSLSLSKGETATLNATVYPSNASNKKVKWSTSKSSVATVSAEGLVTAVGKGEATVTVTTEDGSKTATCKVTVTVPVASISVSPSSATIEKGKTARLTATVTPSDANQEVTWSSSKTSVATVSSDGVVTAVSVGDCSIIAKAKDGSGVVGTATIKVEDTSVAVTSIELTKYEITIDAGAIYDLVATVYPSNATNKTLEWKSGNENIATVSQAGRVTGVGKGVTYINVKATDGSGVIAKECKVTVNSYEVEGISLDKSSLSLTSGSTSQLTATITPDNALNKNVAWTTSNASVATVSESGLVTAVGSGTATITATSAENSSIKATCTVTVTQPIYVTSVSLDKKTLSMYVGDTYTFTVTYTPANATETTMQWGILRNGVISVNNITRTVTALKEGTSSVSVSIYGEDKSTPKTSICNITVSNRVVTGVALDKSAVALRAGETAQLNASIYPYNATIQTVTWTSSDTSVATVNSKGLITAKGKGEATITVKTTDQGKTATCKVKVYDEDVNGGGTENISYDDWN